MAELSAILKLTDEEKAWNPDGANTLPLLISDDVEELLDIPAIRRQFVPSGKENDDTTCSLDPQEEKEHQGTERLVHRYRNRAAFFTTDRCFAYCRHCFRRRFTGHLSGPATTREIEEAAAYIREHNEIREVLLTGGDLFTLSDEKIDQMLSIFKKERRDRSIFTTFSRFRVWFRIDFSRNKCSNIIQITRCDLRCATI